MQSQSYGKINPRCVSCLSEKLTDVQIGDVTSGSMTTPPNVDFGTERVKTVFSEMSCANARVLVLFQTILFSFLQANVL